MTNSALKMYCIVHLCVSYFDVLKYNIPTFIKI